MPVRVLRTLWTRGQAHALRLRYVVNVRRGELREHVANDGLTRMLQLIHKPIVAVPAERTLPAARIHDDVAEGVGVGTAPKTRRRRSAEERRFRLHRRKWAIHQTHGNRAIVH